METSVAPPSTASRTRLGERPPSAEGAETAEPSGTTRRSSAHDGSASSRAYSAESAEGAEIATIRLRVLNDMVAPPPAPSPSRTQLRERRPSAKGAEAAELSALPLSTHRLVAPRDAVAHEQRTVIRGARGERRHSHSAPERHGDECRPPPTPSRAHLREPPQSAEVAESAEPAAAPFRHHRLSLR
jgi:hypothetical protein